MARGTAWRRHWEVPAVGLAVGWAAVLRLGGLGINPFAYDEARLSALALALAREGRIPPAGMVSSVGVPNLPAAVWLFAPPYALVPDPLVATAWMGLWGVATVLGLWWLARQVWGRAPALAVAWLAAGSPYLAFYARNIWAQNWLPVLAVAWGLAAWYAWAREHRWAAGVAGFLAGWAPQVHYAGVTLWVPTLWLLRQRRCRGRVLLGWGIALALALPWLPAVARGGAGAGWTRWRVDVAATFREGFALLSGYGWDRYFIGPEWGLGRQPVVVLAAGGVGIALTWYAWRLWRRPDVRPPHGWGPLLGLWAVSSLLVWSLASVPSHIHYHLAALPAGLLLLGGAVRALPGRRGPWAGVALAAALALAEGVGFLRGVSLAGSVWTPHGISTPLIHQRTAARAVQDGTPVIGVVPGVDPAVDGDAAVLQVLWWSYPHRLVDGRFALLVPDRPAWLFFVAPWLPGWQVLQQAWPPEALAVRFFPKRRGEYPFVLAFVSPASPQGFRPAPPARLANGARLAGWQVLPLADKVRLLTLWRLRGAASREYHQFNHLYVPGRERPVQVHDVPLSSRSWRRGDWLLTWADFDPPLPADAWFGVGMYTYPDVQRVPRLDAADPQAPIRLQPRAPLGSDTSSR